MNEMGVRKTYKEKLRTTPRQERHLGGPVALPHAL